MDTLNASSANGLILVIFGASGDLTARMLIPALGKIAEKGLTPPNFAMLGTGRSTLDDAAFREKIARDNPNPVGDLGQLHYLAFNPADEAGFAALRQRLGELDAQVGAGGNILFYLAVPPDLHEPILKGLTAAGLNRPPPGAWRRIVIEKPFGRDLESARALNRLLQSAFPETAIYRIDHYLGKETVQNILVMRFGNGIFEPLWNRNFISRVEITSAEELGVENRGGYYEQAGALRDMVQNHLLQILGFIAMEPPGSASARSIRRETLKVFQSLKPLTPDKVTSRVVRGQYTESTIRGGRVPGYRQEQGVRADSRTETYVALRCEVDNWRWNGVPFCIRTGKRLPTRVTEVVIHFKPSPQTLFRKQNGVPGPPNQLIIRIQPDEGIVLKFNLKVPGAGFKAREAGMEFHYKGLTAELLPSAYERLLLDAMAGDSTLYLGDEESEATWAFLEPILLAWRAEPDLKLYGYPAGTWGPEAAEALIGEPGETWRFPCKNLTADDTFCEL
ncbi:MAG: glucose-6-phosphate dehydrogenase [Kiritimatiellia bacterium]